MIFKKHGPDIHVHANTLYIVIAVVVVLFGVLLVWKHHELKQAIPQFMMAARVESQAQLQGANAVTTALLVATTVGTAPADKPLYTQKDNLQQYVTTLTKKFGRDVVVMDTHKVILADTVSGNVGKIYQEDKGEVSQTLSDGHPRTYVEKSNDYPAGVSEVVVALKDPSNTTVGAVILSSSSVPQLLGSN